MNRVAIALVIAGGGCRSTPSPAVDLAVATSETTSLVQEVNPFIGTGGHGHTYPGPNWPFGMVQVGPDTRLTGWDGCSGYHYDDDRIYGFSHTHLLGTGISDYADVLLMPATHDGWAGDAPTPHDSHPFAQQFSHSNERAYAGYYAVTLANGVEVELTATPRAGVHRYRFPTGSERRVYVDLVHRDHLIDADLRIVDARTVEGFRRSSGWARDQRVYFVARFSEDIIDRQIRPTSVDGDEERPGEAVLEFAPSEQPLTVAVSISAVDLDGARANAAELVGLDFDRYRGEAEAAWEHELSRARIEGGTSDQRVSFYTGLYRVFSVPNLFSDVDGRYRGTDGGIHRADHDVYTIFSLWDTFRTAHPLDVLLQPERTSDFVRTMLRHHEDGGRLPVWELAGNYTGTMIGYHSVSVIADAWIKGVRGFDGAAALKAMVSIASRDELGKRSFAERGFIAAGDEPESVSKTLEYAYDDWTIARMAEALGPSHSETRARFDRRAAAWRNVFDPRGGFFRPRRNGSFVPGFDPAEVTFDFTEANAWQYAFFVPHDIPGLAAVHGGPDALAGRLDALFDAPAELAGREQADITGLIGQYAHGNEPSHHFAWIYPWVEAAPSGQRRVRQILDTLYANAPDGLAGNEDCGQMSAWYVMSALGVYPVAPGDPHYAVGTPLFDRATLRLADDAEVVIEAVGEGPYVDSVQWNGQALDVARLDHARLLEGGTLRVRRRATPGTWGQGTFETLPSPDASAFVSAPRFVPVPDSFEDSTSLTLASEPPPGCHVVVAEIGEGGAAPPSPMIEPRRIDGSTSLQATTVCDDGRTSGVVDIRLTRRPEGLALDLDTPWHPQYEAGGETALIDGITGGGDFRTSGWQGFYVEDLKATVTLDEARRIASVRVGVLQDQRSWIWLPRELVVEVSRDGRRWTTAGRATHDVPQDADGVVIRRLEVPVGRRVKAVRIHAAQIGPIPDWHPGAGNPPFIFADEIELIE